MNSWEDLGPHDSAQALCLRRILHSRLNIACSLSRIHQCRFRLATPIDQSGSLYIRGWAFQFNVSGFGISFFLTSTRCHFPARHKLLPYVEPRSDSAQASCLCRMEGGSTGGLAYAESNLASRIQFRLRRICHTCSAQRPCLRRIC